MIFALPDPLTTRLGIGESTLRDLTASMRLAVSISGGEVSVVEGASARVETSPAVEFVVSESGVCSVWLSTEAFSCIEMFSLFEIRIDAGVAVLVYVPRPMLSFPAEAATFAKESRAVSEDIGAVAMLENKAD